MNFYGLFTEKFSEGVSEFQKVHLSYFVVQVDTVKSSIFNVFDM